MWATRACYVIETSTKYNRYAARIPKGMGSGEGVVGSLSFDVQGRGHRVQFGPIRTDRKRGEGRSTKIGHFSWMS